MSELRFEIQALANTYRLQFWLAVAGVVDVMYKGANGRLERALAAVRSDCERSPR